MATQHAFSRVSIAAAALGCASLTSCGLFSSQAAGSVANADALQQSIENVHVECELAQQRVRDTSDLLTTLVTGNYQGEPQDVYLRLVTALEASEQQADKLRKTVDGMRLSATPVFEQWQTDLLKITNPNLRRASEDRLDETRTRFDFVVSASRAAETGVDTFNQGTRDITLFLGSDFNPAAITAVAPEARNVEDLAIDVDARLRKTQSAVQEYMQASGIPLGEDFAAPPSAPGGSGNLDAGGGGSFDDDRFRDPRDDRRFEDPRDNPRSGRRGGG